MCPTGTSYRPNPTGATNLRSAFDVLDADRDGKISPEDLKTFYTNISATASQNDDVIGTMMSVADSNKDGYVEYEEFEKVLDGREKNGNNNKNNAMGMMEEAFKVMDGDGDGKVGHKDLKSYLGWAGFEASDEDIRAMIRLGGGDENGGVTFDGLLKVLAF